MSAVKPAPCKPESVGTWCEAYVQPDGKSATLNFLVTNHADGDAIFSIGIVPSTVASITNPDIKYVRYPDLAIRQKGNKSCCLAYNGNIVMPSEKVIFKASSSSVVLTIEGYDDVEG